MSLVISRTPYRISFFGGGSDYPEWYRERGGCVLSTAIDKYCYILCRHQPVFFERKHRIVWSHIETVDTLREILHPAVREGLKYLGFDDNKGIEIHHQGDLPARTGIGSSSSFSVGLIHALMALKGQFPDYQSLAEQAVHLEREILKEIGGVQDQYAAAYGGFNKITFSKEGVKVTPLGVNKSILETLCENLVLVYSGKSRLSSDVSQSIVQNINQKEAYLTLMMDQVEKAEKMLKEGNLDDFGRLLGEGWRLKKELSGNMTTPEINELYDTAIQSGALGGKLIGGGSAGFLLFYVPRGHQRSFKDVLGKFIQASFKIDWEGSTLLLHDNVDLPSGKRVIKEKLLCVG